MDRDIGDLRRNEDKAVKETKKLAQSVCSTILCCQTVDCSIYLIFFRLQGNIKVHERVTFQTHCFLLSVMQVNIRKQVDRLYSAKAQMNSVQMTLQTTVGQCLLAFCFYLSNRFYCSYDENTRYNGKECGYHARNESVSLL